MLINDYSIANKQEAYYNKKFRTVIEANLKDIKKDSLTKKLVYTDEDMYVFRGNLYGFLNFRNVTSDIDMYWIIMRVSGFNSPSDFGYNVKSNVKDSFTDKVNLKNTNNYLLVPSNKTIDNLYVKFSIEQNNN